MVTAMLSLAGGDRSVDVPGTERNDEIGDMAGAVQVFKDNAIEQDRLTKEAEAEQATREARATQIVNAGVNSGHGAGVKRGHLLMPDTVLPVVPAIHRRDPRCFV